MSEKVPPENGSQGVFRPPTASDSARNVGTLFGGYRIEAVLGSGGMGTVYRAHQVALDRSVALKVITPTLAADPEFRARFVRESQLAASLDHPNVVTIYEAGEDAGRLFVTMRLVEGADLRRLLDREGRLAPERAVAIVSQIADALDAAHAAGMVHRDVKPSNILVETQAGTDRAYLCDFGLVKRLAADQDLTGSAGWVGSVDYLAPEQVLGQTVGPYTDVYGLGTLLFSALTGQVPFPRPDVAAKLYASVNEPLPAASSLCGDVPPALDEVLRRATDKDPAARYPTAGALAQAARAALDPQTRGGRPWRDTVAAAPGPPAPPPTAQPFAPEYGSRQQTSRPQQTGRRRKGVVGGGIAALVAVVALVVATLAGAWSGHDNTHPPAQAGSPRTTGRTKALQASPTTNSRPTVLSMKSQLLTVADLPAGWTLDSSANSSSSSGPSSSAGCNVNYNRFQAQATGSVQASFVKQSAGGPLGLEESILSFPDSGRARSLLSGLFQQFDSRCRHFSITENGQTITGSIRALRLGAPYDDKSEAYLGTVNANSETTDFDVVGVVQGSEIMMLAYDGDIVPAVATFNDLVARASVKLRAGTSEPRPVSGSPIAFASNEGVPLPSAANVNTDNVGQQFNSSLVYGYEVPPSADQFAPAPVALAGPTSFVATGKSLQVVDTTSGEQVGNVPAEHRLAPALGPALITPPVIVRLNGKQVALVGYLVTLPGHGLTPSSSAVEIDAVDTQAHRLWAIVTPLRGQSNGDFSQGVRIVGSSGADVVVSADAYGQTFVFDLEARKLLWSSKTVTPFAVAGSMVVGRTQPDNGSARPVGLNLQTGQTVWKGQTGVNVEGVQVGSSTTLVEITHQNTGDLDLVDTRTGAVVKVLDRSATNWSCQSDGQSTGVCGGLDASGTALTKVFAFDSTTGARLWQLPSGGAVAPTSIPGVYHGKVYAIAQSGPLVLDARTGRVLDDSPGIAPLLADSYVGIAYGAAGELEAYPASR